MNDRLKRHLVNGGQVERDQTRARLVLPPCAADSYSDAQIDDYDHALPRTFRNAPPQRLHVRARFSHEAGALKGTAGFGFWNHPFARDGRILLPPCAVWFFFCSPESRLKLTPRSAGHGFVAMALDARAQIGADSPVSRLVVWMGNLALRLPLVRSAALFAGRNLVRAAETPLSQLCLTEWHDYCLSWQPGRSDFWVDGVKVLSAAAPRQPLGFVAWVDNYRAAAAEDAAYSFRFVATEQTQWLELEWLPDSDIRW